MLYACLALGSLLSFSCYDFGLAAGTIVDVAISMDRIIIVTVLANLAPVCVTSVLLPQTANGFVQCQHLVAGG